MNPGEKFNFCFGIPYINNDNNNYHYLYDTYSGWVSGYKRFKSHSDCYNSWFFGGAYLFHFEQKEIAMQWEGGQE